MIASNPWLQSAKSLWNRNYVSWVSHCFKPPAAFSC